MIIDTVIWWNVTSSCSHEWLQSLPFRLNYESEREDFFSTTYAKTWISTSEFLSSGFPDPESNRFKLWISNHLHIYTLMFDADCN